MNNPKRLNEVFYATSESSSFTKVLMGNLDVYPNFPKDSINFIDIFPLFRSKYLIARVTSAFKRAIGNVKALESVTAVVAPESRGFLFGTLLAADLGVPFIPFRKPGKLPCVVIHQEYALEYGTDALEFPAGVLTADDNVLIVDDLLAVGGTLSAMIDTIRNHTDATIHSCATLINLADIPKPNFYVPVVSLLDLKEK
jgi:adenine phosphoribosyltransferase